ncbi:hypothetical protein [Methylosinus sporium]|uniref:hypothetical protein n=1 Tax=Methylosinus sporium TaxID=428 RepID=UPI00383B745F
MYFCSVDASFVDMQRIFGRLFLSRRASRNIAMLLCILVFQSLFALVPAPRPEHGALASTCASSATEKSGAPLDRHCRTLDCCMFGCASHDASWLETAFASAHLVPWSKPTPTRRPGDARSRPLIAHLLFVARGPPAAI